VTLLSAAPVTRVYSASWGPLRPRPAREDQRPPPGHGGVPCVPGAGRGPQRPRELSRWSRH